MATRPEAPLRRVAPKEALPKLPFPAQLFVLLVIGAGLVVAGLDATELRLDRPALFMELLALAAMTSIVKISVPLTRGRSSLSLSFAVTLASIPLLGGPSAVFIGMASAWTQCTFRMKARNPIHRTLFSIAMVGIAVHAAALVFGWGGVPNKHSYLDAVVRPVMLASTAYFAVNSLLLAGAVALSTRQLVVRVWLDNFLWSAPAYFVAGLGAILAVIAADTGSRGWLAAVAVPLYLTYRSYRGFVARLEDEQAHVRHMSEVQLATIEALALAIEVKDRTSQDHIRRIQRYSEGLARAIDMSEPEIAGLKTAALLHDIGNLAVPEHILVKPGALSYDEFQKVKIHPQVGADIVQDVPFSYPVAPVILAHHERWDGTGYPLGLCGESIPLGARVLAVVDCFTALLSERPYRRARGYAEAVAMLQAQSGAALDPALVNTFLEILPALDHATAAPVGTDDPMGSDALVPGTSGGSALDHIVRAHREAQVLYEIAEGLGSTLSLESAAKLLETKLPRVLPFSAGALFVWDAATSRFHCRQTMGASGAALASIAASTVAELAAEQPAADGTVLRSSLVSALRADGDVVGALAVYSADADAYADDHRRLLERVSHPAASVIWNALVFERAQEASLTDVLTGLANRRACRIQAPRDIARAERENTPLSVLLLDLNDLKYLNDTYGHDVGDRALRAVASLLDSACRPSDLCARYGGDEFVVVLPNCDAASADLRSAELQRAVEQAQFCAQGTEQVPLSISAGLATYPADGTTADELLTVADHRMYARKAMRRSRTVAAETPDASLAVAV